MGTENRKACRFTERLIQATTDSQHRNSEAGSNLPVQGGTWFIQTPFAKCPWAAWPGVCPCTSSRTPSAENSTVFIPQVFIESM